MSHRRTSPGLAAAVGAYVPPGIPVTAVLVLDVPLATTGQCAQAAFPGPSPAPACAFNGSGSTLKCK